MEKLLSHRFAMVQEKEGSLLSLHEFHLEFQYRLPVSSQYHHLSQTGELQELSMMINPATEIYQLELFDSWRNRRDSEKKVLTGIGFN